MGLRLGFGVEASGNMALVTEFCAWLFALWGTRFLGKLIHSLGLPQSLNTIGLRVLPWLGLAEGFVYVSM